MEALIFVAFAVAPSVFYFVTTHLLAHQWVGRHLPPAARQQWRHLRPAARWRVRRTARRGRAIGDPELAELTAQAARVERTALAKPSTRRASAAYTVVAAAIGIFAIVTGDALQAAMTLTFAALCLWSTLCVPKIVACLERGERANATAAS